MAGPAKLAQFDPVFSIFMCTVFFDNFCLKSSERVEALTLTVSPVRVSRRAEIGREQRWITKKGNTVADESATFRQCWTSWQLLPAHGYSLVAAAEALQGY